MTIVRSLLPRTAAESVLLTVTVGNAALGGVAARIAELTDLEGGDPVDGAGDESSRTFDLGVGSGLGGKVVLCVATVANVAGVASSATVTWAFENARTLLNDAEYSETETLEFDGNVAESVAQFRFVG